jgi:hypothetical protein
VGHPSGAPELHRWSLPFTRPADARAVVSALIGHMHSQYVQLTQNLPLEEPARRSRPARLAAAIVASLVALTCVALVELVFLAGFAMLSSVLNHH